MYMESKITTSEPWGAKEVELPIQESHMTCPYRQRQQQEGSDI